MPNFEAFPDSNHVEENEQNKQEQEQAQEQEQTQEQEQEQAQEKMLRFMLNRRYDESGYEHPFDQIQNAMRDYPALSQEDIVRIYLDEQEYETVANFIDKFPEVDHRAVAAKLLNGKGSHVLRNLDKFNGVSREDVERDDWQPEAE